MPEPMSAERLAEIRQREQLTTGAPWKVLHDGFGVWSEPLGGYIADFDWIADSDATLAQLISDAVFVAAARTDVPDLLAEVDRLRAKLDAPCGSCHPCMNYADETWRDAGRTPPHVYMWDELNAQVDAVHTIHPYEIHGGRGVCGSCRDSSEDPMPWPCPTMAALGEQPTRGDL